ncbi:hypothetical protein LguiB_007484 [Lonicera macranthoides]
MHLEFWLLDSTRAELLSSSYYMNLAADVDGHMSSCGWRDHPLDLTFRPPYETKGFSCDICSKIGSKQWLYRCVSCEFDVHMDCATATPTPTPRAQPQRSHPFPGLLAAPRPLLQPQQHHSFPVAQIQQQPLQHYHSFPLPQAQAPPQPQQVSLQHHHSYPGVGASPRPVSQQNYYVQGASTGAVQSGGRTGAGVSGNGLMNAMFQGLVEGAAQQVGQTLMQSVIGGGGGGGGDGGGGDYGGGDYGGDFSGDSSSILY